MIVYESERAIVVQSDSRDYLGDQARESVGLVVTDPPYGVEWQSHVRKDTFELLHNDGVGDRGVVEDVLEQCVRVVGQSRHLYVFGPPDVLGARKCPSRCR